MIGNQQLLQNTTVVVLAVLFIVAASFTMVAYADDDHNVVEYDVDDEAPDVPYHSLVEVTGDAIENEDVFVLTTDDSDEAVIDDLEADEDGVVEIDTSYLDGDVLGDYEIHDPAEGDVNIDEADTEAVLVDYANANVDYEVVAYDADEDELDSEEFDADEDVDDLELTAEVDDDEDVTVVVYGAGEELASDDVTADDENEVDGADDATEDGDAREAVGGFEVVEEEAEEDERLEHAAFDSDDAQLLDRVWVGQELVLTDDDDVIEAGDSYTIEYQDGDDSEFVTEVTAQESDGVHDTEIVIDTTYPDVDTELVGDFALVDGNEELVEWNTQAQDMNVSTDPSFVNLNTDHTDVEMNLTSVRAGPYDVVVSSDQVDDGEELLDLVDEDELDSNMDAMVDPHDEDYLRVTDVDTSSDAATVPLDFEEADEDEYEFEVSAADADATGDAEVEAAFDAQGDANFDQGTYTQTQGDIVEMTIDLEATDYATVRFAEDDYDLEFDVEDGTGDGEVTLLMDTYRAGDYQDYGVVDADDVDGGVFATADEDDEIHVDDNTLPSVSGDFSTGLYSLEMEVEDDEADLATLEVVERESHDITTYVMPNDERPSLDDLEEHGTERDQVAEDDWFVVEVEASGIFSDTLLTNDTHPAALIDFDERDEDGVESVEDLGLEDEADDLSEMNLHIEEQDPERHNAETQMLLENADELEIAPDEDSFYMFFDTRESDVFDTFDDDFDASPQTEYDIDFNVTEDYKYVDEDDNSADLHEEVELVDREVTPQLSSVTVDEEDLDTRFGLPAESNATVTGETAVAPGTDVSVRVRSEGVDPILFREDATVDEDGMVSAEYDLSDEEVDREMTIQFFPLGDREEAIMVEPETPPEIEGVDANTPVTEGEEVEFELDVDHEDEDELSYDWDLGDDESSSIAEPVHIYDEPGTYNTSVTVTDAAGQSDEAEMEVVVEEAPNEPPVIEELIGPDEADVDESVDFGALATDDTHQDELEYSWDFDDGATASGVSTSHSFDSEGTYDVELTVTDNEGEEDSQSHTVQVEGDGDGTENGDDDESTLTVTAVDSEEDESIPGATVSVEEDDELVDGDQTDDDGVMTIDLEEGAFDVEVTADGYEDFTAQVEMDGDEEEIDAMMDPEDDGDDDEDPDQPGFTLLLAALALVALGGFIYYRRQIQA